MKLEVRCPSCHKGYLLEESALGGEFWCPACSTPITLEQAPVAAAPARAPTQTSVVVCPRCRLHFTPSRRPAAPTGARPRVLIVDEEGYFRTTAVETLSADYDVVAATSVVEAETVMAQGVVDLMILDLGIDGDHGKRLLRPDRTSLCPVLIFTSRDESEMYGGEWGELQKLGANDIVIKGMNAAESLKRKVGALLGRQADDEEALK